MKDIITTGTPTEPPPAMSKAAWTGKLIVCAAYDFFDFTIGRLMFATPFVGEAIGVGIACLMFGKSGMLYGLEALDMTEQLDGFMPTATLIALKNKP